MEQFCITWNSSAGQLYVDVVVQKERFAHYPCTLGCLADSPSVILKAQEATTLLKLSTSAADQCWGRRLPWISACATLCSWKEGGITWNKYLLIITVAKQTTHFWSGAVEAIKEWLCHSLTSLDVELQQSSLDWTRMGSGPSYTPSAMMTCFAYNGFNEWVHWGMGEHWNGNGMGFFSYFALPWFWMGLWCPFIPMHYLQ